MSKHEPFDETRITKAHVREAIRSYLEAPGRHRAAKSAFLIHEGVRLPAKRIVALAYEFAAGRVPDPEEHTGGRAAVRVLSDLGFETEYVKPVRRTAGTPREVKSRRRKALADSLARSFGPCSFEASFRSITVPDLVERADLRAPIRKILDAVEGVRGYTVKGRAGHVLKFDLYFAKVDLVVEYDERQHFTLPRAASLHAYPVSAPLGFDRKEWIRLAEKLRKGDNSPIYRDEQRALYDSIRDLEAPKAGLAPVVRVFDDEVAWENEGPRTKASEALIEHIEGILS